MPYIKQEQRFYIQDALESVTPENAGELNFTLTKVIDNYWQDKGRHYQTINDIIGALEGAKLEFYRRIAVPYEDTKIKENGDVY